MCRTGVLAAVLLGTAGIFAQSNGSPVEGGRGPAQVTFQLERAGVMVPRYTMVVREDGSGSYRAEEDVASFGAVEERNASNGMDTGPRQMRQIKQPLSLSPKAVRQIFAAAHALRLFQTECASKLKNIADTGTKTLSYAGQDGAGSCSYKFSTDKKVVQLTTLFVGVETTLEMGRLLAFKHRYDRLGLDALMESLEREVEQGEAVELETIAPVLQSIAEDNDVIGRVRVRASKLLEQAGAQVRE